VPGHALRDARAGAPGTSPPAAQLRERQVRGELATAEPDRPACSGALISQGYRVAGDPVRFLLAAAFPDQCSGVPQPDEEVLLSAGRRGGLLDQAAERDPGRLRPGLPLGLLGLGAGGADGCGAVSGSSHGQAGLFLDRHARLAGAEEVVVDVRQHGVLAGEGRRDVNMVNSALR